MSNVVALNTGAVAEEMAEREFMRFAEVMDLDIDPKGMDEDDRKELDELKRKVVRAIVRGKLVIDDDGQPVYSPMEGDPITFAEPRGKAFQASDLKKEGHNVKKMFAAMADFTGMPEAVFMNMRQRDLRVCLAVAKLFLA